MAAELAGSERDGRRLIAGLAEDPAARLELRQALIDRDLVDFDGLTELAAALLGEHPAVAAALRDRWPRISVDEYQDIDAVQYGLIRAISGDGAGLTAIGDPDQSIYGFRGADVGIFGRFAADFPGATTVELTRNYRSDPVIVTAAMQAIAPATLVPGRAAAARARPAAAEPDPADPLAAITWHEAADEQAEAAWIAGTDRPPARRGLVPQPGQRPGRRARPRQARAGRHRGAVPDRRAGRAARPGADPGRAAVPEALARPAVPPDRSGRHHARAAAAGPRLGRGRSAPWSGRLTAAVRGAGRGHGASGTRPSVDIRAAGELLAPLARRCGADLERFAAEVSLGAETDALDPRAEAITLLTLHGAKGLEFDVVFLAGCESGLLPLRLPGAGPLSPADSAEERRLLFVGMTRARGKLLLSCAARRSRHGAESAAGRSPFLAAIQPGLLGQATAARRPPPRRPSAAPTMSAAMSAGHHPEVSCHQPEVSCWILDALPHVSYGAVMASLRAATDQTGLGL